MLAAMILAAGLGTRLRPLTDLCAKPLVPVGDRPALAHVLARLRAAGASRVVVNAHHRADDLHRFALGHGELAVSQEDDLLGTAGGIARARALLGEGEVIVWNGDVLADVDLAGLVLRHAADGADATLVVQPRARGQGPVGIDRRGHVVRLRRERFGEEVQGGEFLGISVIGASFRAGLPDRGCLVADGWLPLLRRRGTVRAFHHDGPFYDIGTVPRYLAANLAWLRARGAEHFLGAGAWVADGVSLEESILGEGAEAAGSGAIARCVVWPGAKAVAPLADAVVAPGLVVEASSP